MSISETVEESSDLFESLAESAKKYAELGYRVLPCQPDADTVPNDRRKAPFGKSVPHGVKDASNDVETVEGWWTKEPTCNVGIAGGNGLIVIDVDVKKGKDGVADINRIFADAGEPSPIDSGSCPMAKTPSGGYHLFYHCENSAEYRSKVSVEYKGEKTAIDVRADRTYVVAAPSWSESGGRYVWERLPQPVKRLPELPECLKNVLPKKNDKPQPPAGKPQSDFRDRLSTPVPNTGISATDRMRRVYAYLDETEPSIEHQNGHTSLYTALGRVSWGFDLNEDETRQAANYLNDTRCEPKFEPEALDHKIEDAMTKWKNHQGKPRGHLWTESRRNSVPEVDAEFDRMVADINASAAAKRKATSTQQETPVMSENDDNQPLGIQFDDLHPDDETFPLDAFPKVMQRYIRSVAESMNVPERMVALPLLVEMAGVIGSTKELEIYEERYLKASLWGMYIAEPGEKKSPVLNEIKTLIEDRDAIARAEYDKAAYVYKVEKDKFDKAFKAGNTTIDQMPVAPKSGSIIIGKATMEAIFDKILNNTRGVFIIRDELSGLVQGLDQYKKGKGDDFDSLLELYDGGNISVDTKTAGSSYIRDCTCSVFGGIQPQRFRTLFHTQVNIDSGFFARFIPLWIPEADSISVGTPVDAKAKKDMRGAVDNLWLLEKTAYQGGGNVLYRPGRMKMDDQSRKLFIGEENFYQRMKKRAATSAVKGVLSKVAARSAKIAFIFALVELADVLREIPAEDNKTYINKPDLHVTENWMKAAIRVNFWLAMEVYRWMADSTEYENESNQIKSVEMEITFQLKNGDISKREMDRKYKSKDGKQALRNLLDAHAVTTVTKERLTSRGCRGVMYYSLVTS